MNNDTNTEEVVYEIGFHLIPLVAEDEVATHVSGVKSILDKAGARVIAEEAPALTELAYTISKRIKGSREDFDTAYFGWIKFVAEREAIKEIDEAVRATEEILRFIIVKTLQEDTRFKREEEGEEDGSDDEDTMTDEEMDQAIDELVIE